MFQETDTAVARWRGRGKGGLNGQPLFLTEELECRKREPNRPILIQSNNIEKILCANTKVGIATRTVLYARFA